MTRPPEYDQVARWLRALTGDPALIEELKATHPGGVLATRDEDAERERQRLADEARDELAPDIFHGIELQTRNLDRIAEAYHCYQISEYARGHRDVQETIRQLTDGDFKVPSWLAHRSARDGIDLSLVIEDHRDGALFDAHADLGALDAAYAVTEDEVQAYWAARYDAHARHLIDKHHAEPERVAGDAATLDQLDSIHDAAHRYLDRGFGIEFDRHDEWNHQPWGQLVMEARADEWWARRDRLYTHRPEVMRRAALGSVTMAPPSAMEDPGEWEAFFQEVLGRCMPRNAAYEAENYRIDAAAPPSVHGMAAVSYPDGYDYGVLAGERDGLSLEELYLKRYEELHASHTVPGTTSTRPTTTHPVAASFPAETLATAGPPAAGRARPPAQPRHAGPRRHRLASAVAAAFRDTAVLTRRHRGNP